MPAQTLVTSLPPILRNEVVPEATFCRRETRMGLMPTEGGNPFTKLDARSVVGMFKATGSRDPDVLHAQREKRSLHPSG